MRGSIPSSLSKSLSRDNKSFTLFQGLNFIADLKLSSAPNNLKSIFKGLNISSNFTLPLRGKLPNNFFKNIFPLKKPTSHNDNLLKNAKLENIYKQLNRKFSRNFIQDININATLPKSINFQGLSINDASFLIKGTQDNQLSFGINASKVDVHNLTLENILSIL